MAGEPLRRPGRRQRHPTLIRVRTWSARTDPSRTASAGALILGGVPNLVWTTAAEPAQLVGHERIAFSTLLRDVVVRDGGARSTLATPAAGWLARVRAAPALAVLGVRLRSVEDLAALHGY